MPARHAKMRERERRKIRRENFVGAALRRDVCRNRGVKLLLRSDLAPNKKAATPMAISTASEQSSTSRQIHAAMCGIDGTRAARIDSLMSVIGFAAVTT